MSFGSDLLKGLNVQAGSGESTPRDLNSRTIFDKASGSQGTPYGSLGDYAKKIDSTAQRSYVESGYIRNVKPRYMEPLLQEPDLTVVVKKKMFTSLINNYQFELMDQTDKNFIKASKRLFQNKCQAISVYEKLTKLERLIDRNDGQFNDMLMPMLTTGIEAAQAFGFNWVSPKTKAALDSINKWKSFSSPELYTTWMVEPMAPYASSFGEGTGAFEITLVASANTTASTQFGGGKLSLSIDDPYHLTFISNEDIDNAIADTYNIKQTSTMFQFSETELRKQTADLLTTLNQSRLSRNTTSIIIQVNEYSILSKRVRAFIDEEGREILFNFNPGLFGVGAGADIDDGAFEGKNGLTESEGNQLSKIIKNTLLILNLKKERESKLDDVTNEDNKKEINYIREKMRLQFGNKNIIQVMDSVHVFASSKTAVDNFAIGVNGSSLSGTGSNLLTSLNTTVNNLEQSFNNLQGFFGGTKSQDSFVEAEKDAIMGADFPTWLWSAMRNSFTRQAAGVHIGAGVVSSVTSNYGNGKYTLTVECSDNTAYFRMGQINTNPGVAPIDREIFDPLTPFDLDFDASTGFLIGETPKLLPENEKLLLSGAVKFKNGSRFAGSPLSSFLYGIGDSERQDSSSARSYQKVFFDPDGFVYRWKSGIGTFTFNGPRYTSPYNNQRTSPRLTVDAFAGQDVMNVLSLLITGQPYNYNNFINGAIQNGALAFNTEQGGAGSRSDLDNVSVAVSFFRNLIGDLQKNNVAWGNFIPFKKLIVNEQGLNFLLFGQFNVTKNSAQLNSLLEKRAKLFDAFTLVSTGFANNPNVTGIGPSGSIVAVDTSTPVGLTPEGEQAFSQLIELDKKIVESENQLFESYKQANTGDGSFTIFGDDASLSDNINEGTSTESQRNNQREQFRRKLHWLTLRRLWKVKAAEDPNLLIVDDQYDKDYDIQAFSRALTDKMGLFKSDYSDTFNQISQVSQILGLEVFADTQGHIQVRPPGYNKIPSSVFERMLRDKKRLFPKALESLFVTQIEGLINALEINEDEIRLRGAALGYVDDATLSKFLNGNARGDLSGRVGQGTFTFKFISSSEGIVAQKPGAFKSMVQQDSPDLRESAEFKELINIGEAVAGQTRETGLFDKSAQIRNFFFKNEAYKVQNDTTQSRYEEIQFRLSKKKNIQVPSQTQLFSNVRSSNGNQYRTQGDILKVTREIASFVSERQGIMKKLKNAIKNIEQGVSINQDSNTRRAALFPDLTNNKKTEFPSIIAHMIEDENEDDLGFGSGGRYIIKDNQILSMTLQESPPDFTMVEVNGLYGEGFVNPAANLEIGRGGNAQVAATAVDYDLWRMYGFKVSNARPAPFLSDPDTQCSSVATWMLTEQRRKILHGSITMAGNEYMQPGEVVYIESKDLLFYVESVSHSFNWGGQFTTQLLLTYGHNPGEYFPTMLDIVGKGLYSKQHNANISKNVRFDNADGSQIIGIITVDPNDTSEISTENRLIEGRYADQNRKTLTNLILTASGATVPGSNFEPKIEIRYYYNSAKGFVQSSQQAQSLKKSANSIVEWLKNPTKTSIGATGSNDSMIKQPIATGLAGSLGFKKKDSVIGPLPDASIPEGLRLDQIDKIVSINAIDLSSKTDSRSPSPKAWLAARESNTAPSPYSVTSSSINAEELASDSAIAAFEDLTKQYKTNKTITGNDPRNTLLEERALYTNIIDIWITFNPVPETIETTKSNIAGQASQASIDNAQAIIDANNAQNAVYEESE